MAHSNISIFVPHAGCPFRCSFCDQNTISGENALPHKEDVERICRQAVSEISDPANTEIAFFGGSFTAIERRYMIELLEAAKPFIGENGFKGIRISTRPDFIDDEVLSLLKEYGVTSIELGAQSLDDSVLEANNRGHTAADVYNACKLIRDRGFELGLQLMIGLYKSNETLEISNMSKVLDIKPDTVRIYPVVILKNTLLGRLFRYGEYIPMPFEAVVGICSQMLKAFEQSGIRVIKCGLHASEFVERDMIGGYYHPAFREICESKIYKDEIISELQKAGFSLAGSKERIKLFVEVSPDCISKAAGHKKSNTEYFKNLGIDIKIVADENIPRYVCEIRR
ncbi:MAG: radical SAM protein [Ruminococcus sp.]|nr:radical SAM protein [Ruminococcus sp.]